LDLHDIIDKARDAEPLSRDEVMAMLALPADSPETYAVMAEASRVSREVSGNLAEIHAQLALNLAPCPRNCLFCSFASANRIFQTSVVIPPGEAAARARQFEKDGANAIYVMATATFDLGRFLEASQEIRRVLRPETVMVANVGDEGADRAADLVKAGYRGVYHALRLREGRDTTIEPARRRESIRAFREAGLAVGTCVEPIGPEHGNDELAELILYTGSLAPAFSGAARRIPIPGTALAERGMISELRMAQIVAVTRLAVPRNVRGNCSHEPGAVPILGGANLLWAEAGANPRDTLANTEGGRGHSVPSVRQLFAETEWATRIGSSSFFG
jgi:biotin synthase